MNKFADGQKLKAIYFFDQFENNKQHNFAKEQTNKARSMLFLSVAVHETGNYSIISQLQPDDLRQLLEDVLKKLNHAKAVIPLDKV